MINVEGMEIGMKITHMKTNHIVTPLGFDMEEVRLSYIVEGAAGRRQTAAQIQVAADEIFGKLVYDSGMVETVYDTHSGRVISGIDNACFILPMEILPRTRYYWRVCVWTDAGECVWSEPTWFETPKGKDEVWEADFITPEAAFQNHPILEKRLKLDKEVEKARAYMVGLGAYEFCVNSEKVGDEYLLPGLHVYDSWLQYQTFALNLHKGENLLEVLLGNGWYQGEYGLKRVEPCFGRMFCLIAEIHITYADGSVEIIGTDESWQARESNVVEDTIYHGEIMNALSGCGGERYSVKKLELSEEVLEHFKEEQGTVLETQAFLKGKLQPRLSPYIRIQERITPTLICTPKGEMVLDMGQNMTGWMEFDLELPKGETVCLKYGEILQEGNFYRENLRKARCEFRYTSDGARRVIRPHFTFFGFRYVMVEGWRAEWKPEDFTGCVIHSEMERTGFLETSNELVNKLFENIVWGQKGNFLDVPTDCPQRDERMGWTGDAQVFCDVACFNADTYAFYEKFGRDLAYDQAKCGGSVPYVVPMAGYNLHGATAWGEAATIIPWQNYLHFGDKHILKAQYNSMKAWVEHIRGKAANSGNKNLWLNGRHFGDWLALDGKIAGGVYGRTDADYIASCYYYYSTVLLAKSAKLLERIEDAIFYERLAVAIKEDIQEEYFTASGRLAVDTQTAYAMAAFLRLVPQKAWQRFCGDFRKKLQENNFRLETGFVGTPYLLIALSECGHFDIAYKLLLQEGYPGWLYEVKQGATTVWERWNSVMEDGSMNPQGMNSLNHYAYGAVASWIYRYLCGISPREDAVGFRAVDIHIYPDKVLEYAALKLQTVNGEYKVKWQYRDNKLKVELTIPFGCVAKVSAPEGCIPQVGYPRNLESGHYEMEFAVAESGQSGWSLESDWREALENPEARKIMEGYFPRAVKGIAFQKEMYTIGEVAGSPFSEMEDEQIRALDVALRTMKIEN